MSTTPMAGLGCGIVFLFMRGDEYNKENGGALFVLFKGKSGLSVRQRERKEMGSA